MIKRLIKFYNDTDPQTHESLMTCIWEGITRVYQKGLISALRSGDEASVLKELENVTVTGSSHGMNVDPLAYSSSDSNTDRTKLTDEQLSIPAVSDEIKNDIILYGRLALLVKQLNGGVPEKVMEIGGGLGFLSVIMFRWGAKLYSGIDLPSTAVQAAFLSSRCCGEENVLLGREPDSNQRIQFHTASDYSKAETHKYDVIVNMCSFPEIPPVMQNQYLALISRCLSPKGFFLSVNHEHPHLGQRNVVQAMSSQSSLVCASYQPSAILDGYFDGIYRLE